MIPTYFIHFDVAKMLIAFPIMIEADRQQWKKFRNDFFSPILLLMMMMMMKKKNFT